MCKPLIGKPIIIGAATYTIQIICASERDPDDACSLRQCKLTEGSLQALEYTYGWVPALSLVKKSFWLSWVFK
jgi:hypothetical protein